MLAAVITVLGVAIALGTLIKACLEYVRQGQTERLQMFFELRRRLKQEELGNLAQLIDEAMAPEPEFSEPAKRALASTPFRVKRDYLGLFEEVGMAVERGLIEPEIAHYMFGYYALLCASCPAFWIGVDQMNPYWDRFYGFCERMYDERERFERDRPEAGRRVFVSPVGQRLRPGVAGQEQASQA